MLTLSLWAIAAARPLQVVFSAECNHLFDWHTAALVYSMELSGFGKTANLSRLLACAGKEREAYSEANLALAPHTFVHRNMRDDPLVDEKGCGPDRCKVHSLSSTAIGPRQTTRPSTACTPRLNHDALHDASTQGTPRTTSLTPSWRGLRSDRRCLTERCSRTPSALFLRTTAAPSPPLHPRHRRPGPWVLPPRRRRQPQHPPRRR